MTPKATQVVNEQSQPRNTPTSSRGNETYELVLRTSTELFAERGYHGTSMRQLAERADMRTSGFYYYFRSKYDVLIAIIESATASLEEEAAGVPTSLAPEDQLALLIEGHVRVHLTKSETTRVVDRELQVLNEVDRERYLSRLGAYENRFRSALREGVAGGKFAKDLDVTIATKSVLMMATGVYEWWKPDGPQTVDETARTLAGFALGVATSGTFSK